MNSCRSTNDTLENSNSKFREACPSLAWLRGRGQDRHVELLDLIVSLAHARRSPQAFTEVQRKSMELFYR